MVHMGSGVITAVDQTASARERNAGKQEPEGFFLIATSAMNLVCLKYRITHFPKQRLPTQRQ